MCVFSLCEPSITIPLDKSAAPHLGSTAAQGAELGCLEITLKQIHYWHCVFIQEIQLEQCRSVLSLAQCVAEALSGRGNFLQADEEGCLTGIEALEALHSTNSLLIYHFLSDLIWPNHWDMSNILFNPRGNATSNSLAEPNHHKIYDFSIDKPPITLQLWFLPSGAVLAQHNAWKEQTSPTKTITQRAPRFYMKGPIIT